MTAMQLQRIDFEEQLFNSLTIQEDEAKEIPKKPSVRFSEDYPEKPSSAPRRRLSRDIVNKETGNPGSRKYRRFLNKLELLDQALSDSESDVDIEVVFTCNSRSYFRNIFQNPELQRAWEPFIEVTEEEQEKLLNILQGEKKFRDVCKRPRKARRQQFPTAPEECFGQLHSFQKDVILRFSGNPLVEELETLIVDFFLSSRESMNMQRRDRSERFIIYCICSYYSLCTTAMEEIKADCHPKSLMVYKQKGAQLPETRLSEYLMQFSKI